MDRHFLLLTCLSLENESIVLEENVESLDFQRSL